MSLTEATSGQLLLTNTAYSQASVDSLLLAKQPALTVSGVQGDSLLNGQVLKRLDFDSVFSVSDLGHALNISASGLQESLINSTGNSEGERIDLWNGSAKWIRCLEFFPRNIFSCQTGSDNINVNLDLSGYTTATTLAAAVVQSNPTSDQTNLKNLYHSAGKWIKSLYLANANGSTLTSDNNMLTLTLGSYTTSSDLTSALASYATTIQLNANWLDTLSPATR